MRIRNKKDVEALDKRIQDELGIDVKKYRNEEVVEQLTALLLFPRYVVRKVLRPMLIAVLLFVAGFFLPDLTTADYLLYGSIGFFLFMMTGGFISMLILVRKMKGDMWNIMDYSLDIMDGAVSDLHQAHHHVRSEDRVEAMSLLFHGIIHIVTIPMLAKGMTKGIPVIGKMVSRVAKRVLTRAADLLKFNEEKLQSELKKSEEEPNALQTYSKSIDMISNGLDKVMDITFGIAQVPLLVASAVSTIILALFVNWVS